MTKINKKNNLKRFFLFKFISFLIFIWVFSTWPKLFEFSVEISMAAQVTIDNDIDNTQGQHNGTSPTTVFIDDNTGYAFYIDSSDDCAYSKTTDGGDNWGTAVPVYTSGTNCMGATIWYDRWTPGDNSGTYIHIAATDGVAESINYLRLNTTDDSLSTSIDVTPTYTGTLTNNTNLPAPITKGTDGKLYSAVTDGAANIFVTCDSNSNDCTNAGNWSASNPASWAAGNDWLLLVPLLSTDIMMIWFDASDATANIHSQIYTGSTNSWSGSWTDIATEAGEQATYDGHMGATIDRSTGDVYFVFASTVSTLGSNDDIITYLYSGGSWTQKTDVVTNSVCAGVADCGITGAKIAFDENTGDVYVLYSAVSTPATVTTGNVFFKKSTDGMTTWSNESADLYSIDQDIYGARISIMGPKLYATWYEINLDDLIGNNIGPTTFEQVSYRFFNNNNSTDVGSALASLNTAGTLASTGDTFRLRTLVHIGGGELPSNGQSFKLQFAEKSGTCDIGFSGESYADVTGATVIAYNNNATPADGDNLTANANDPTHGGDTIVNQDYEEANNFNNTVASIPEGQDGKWDFSLIDNGATGGASYCFRIVKSNGDQLDTYTVIPEIAMSSSGIQDLDQINYRWRDDDGSETAATWLATENTTLFSIAKNTTARIRFLVSNEGTADSASTTYRLEVSEADPSSCSAGTYTRVDTDTAWDMSLSSNFTDGDATTNVSGGLTDENSSFVAGQIKESNDTTTGITLTSSEFTEIEYSIKATSSALAGSNYCFRLTNAGTALDTYTRYPSATIEDNSISFSISDNTIGFGSLDYSDDRFATGDLTGSSSETIAHTLSASTNANNGYTLQISGATLTSGANNISAIGGTAASSSVGQEQFGIRMTASGGIGNVSAPYNSGTQYAYDGVSSPDTIASSGSGDGVSTTYSAYYIGNINQLTEAGNYTTTLNYTMTANY